MVLKKKDIGGLTVNPQRSFFNNTRPFLTASCDLYALLTQLIDV